MCVHFYVYVKVRRRLRLVIGFAATSWGGITKAFMSFKRII